jgi:hypothetical protein
MCSDVKLRRWPKAEAEPLFDAGSGSSPTKTDTKTENSTVNTMDNTKIARNQRIPARWAGFASGWLTFVTIKAAVFATLLG